ncbi:ATP-binding cassette domain-containing protein [Paenibacillus paeoniae]|uniref:ATP-binding cassette domain-containing protein n=2 Tax=Paenibacillus paeoniae TaxID=2292705 RepID=A0A371P6W6_9BACL|nr:ATP-binding cassette domain-containing protein [Paenibacillus paeoniae]
MLTGRLAISSGEIRVNGMTLAEGGKAYLSQVGFLLLEEGTYENLSVKELLSFYKKLYHSVPKIEDVIRFVKLDTKANTRIHKLTLSEKRRVQYARLWIQDPEIFIFEEPDQNVDIETKTVFQRLVSHLNELSKAILILTGNMESAIGVTSRIYRLDEKGLKAYDIQESLMRDWEDGEKPSESTELEALHTEDNLSEVGDAPANARDSLSSDKDDELADDEVELGESPVIQFVRFEKIPTRMNDKMILFNPPEIDYIESFEGQTQLYINGDVYPSTFKINELEERLRTYGFFRCHRSYIVNLQKVREIVTFTRNSFSLILDDASRTSVPLSKTKMAELKDMMGLK